MEPLSTLDRDGSTPLPAFQRFLGLCKKNGFIPRMSEAKHEHEREVNIVIGPPLFDFMERRLAP